jgi:hypothetical protein
LRATKKCWWITTATIPAGAKLVWWQENRLCDHPISLFASTNKIKKHRQISLSGITTRDHGIIFSHHRQNCQANVQRPARLSFGGVDK